MEKPMFFRFPIDTQDPKEKRLLFAFNSSKWVRKKVIYDGVQCFEFTWQRAGKPMYPEEYLRLMEEGVDG
jgi:hypothetical protein